MVIKHILFDLDGTLLPMRQDDFISLYMPLLAKSYKDKGIDIDTRGFIAAVWKGFGAMVNNNGSCTNREAFWKHFGEYITIPIDMAEKIALDFYDGAFNMAKAATYAGPSSNAVVKAAKNAGKEVYLATNPVFPRCATMNRIRWAGLDAEDFRIITTYEDNCYCKPNTDYYKSIIDVFGLDPGECLMVGNDVEDDLSIRRLGASTFLLTDTMENKKNLPIETDYMGSMSELLSFIRRLS